MNDYKVSFSIMESNYGRLIFLGLLSMALSSFTPMSIFVPIPVALAFIFNGRREGWLQILVGTTLFGFLALSLDFSIAFGLIFLFMGLLGALIAEIILRKEDPLNGFLKAGAFMVTMITVVSVLFVILFDVDLKKEVTDLVGYLLESIKTDNPQILESKNESVVAWKKYFEDPGAMARDIISWIPMAIFNGVFVPLWIGLLVILKYSSVWKNKCNYSYGIDRILNFKVPDFFIWIVILGLALTLLADNLPGQIGPIIGPNILYCLGLFYFFQGFGIYISFLNALKIYGFLRTFLIMMTVLLAARLLAIIGIMNLWIDFHKYFANMKKEK